MSQLPDTYSPTRAQNFFFVKSTFATLLALFLIIGGYISWNYMTRENFPDLEIPAALIITEWEGASAEQIEKEVTQELEKELRGLKGLKAIDSGSYAGVSMIAVEFQADFQMLEAMSILRDKVFQARLAKETKTPQIIQTAINNIPIVNYMISGNVQESQLQSIAVMLQKELEQINGVRKVNIAGKREPTVYIQLHLETLRALKISPVKVKNRLYLANRDASWGNVEIADKRLGLQFEGRFDSVDELESLDIHRFNDGKIIRLADVADIKFIAAKPVIYTQFSRGGGEFTRGVGIEVVKMAGADTINIIEQVQKRVELAQQKNYWLKGVNVIQTHNEGEIIDDAFNNVVKNIWQAMLAVFVIMFVLMTWREALIASMAVPITLLSSLALLMLFGYTLNTLVIIGMVLALGMLVDVFILVMDGMHSSLYVHKLGFAQSCVRTVKMYSVPAFAGQMTTIFAMIPLITIGGIDGKFIRVIPVTVIFSLLMSFVIAFLVCIPLSKYILLIKGSKGFSENLADRFFISFGEKFAVWLKKIPLSSRLGASIWLIIPGILFFVVLVLSGYLPSEMYPKSDGRNLGITLELNSETTLDRADKLVKRGESFLSSLPYIESVTSYSGKKSPLSVSNLKEALQPEEAERYIGYSVVFKPKSERKFLAFHYLDEIRHGLQTQFADIPDAEMIFTPHLSQGGEIKFPIQIVIKGNDIYQLASISKSIQQALYQIQGAVDISDNIGQFRTVRVYKPDYTALNLYQLTELDLAEQIRLATEFDEISKFKQPGTQEDAPIRMGGRWVSQEGKIGGPKSMTELASLQIISPKGDIIPLNGLVNEVITQRPFVYLHENGERSITIRANTQGITANEVLAQLLPQLEQMKQQWPVGYSFHFAGEAQTSEESFSQMGTAFFISLFLVFGVLVLIFGNYRQPFIVFITVPLGMIGAFGGAYYFAIPISFPTLMGLITLTGIVVNNAIVMVETINKHAQPGKIIKDVIVYSAAERLRPIIGTTMTTIVGLFPIAMSDPTWYPLCMAIICGLFISMIVSLVLVPTFYWLLQGKKEVFD